MGANPACAIGRLERGGPWVGFLRETDGTYRLAFADRGGQPVSIGSTGAARRADLLAVAIAYFEEAFDDAPAELEATQRDVAELVRWLTVTETEPRRANLLQEALDAVDDGLAGDVVVARLAAVLAVADPGRPADAAARLRAIHRSIRSEG